MKTEAERKESARLRNIRFNAKKKGTPCEPPKPENVKHPQKEIKLEEWVPT